MLKISFIIPAYNTAKYLKECFNSLLEQGVYDFEIIIVDDGSTDDTWDIMTTYASQHSCIVPMRQANAGQGAARNAALTRARGEYVWCIDADDWIEEKALLRIYALLFRHNPDVFFCNYIKHYPDGRLILNQLSPAFAGRIHASDVLNEAAFAAIACWSGAPWRMIIRRDILQTHDIRFPSGLFYEDHPFSIQVMRHAASVFVDAPPTYVYRQRPDSTVRRQDKRVFDFFAIRAKCLALFRQYGWSDRYPNLYASYLLPGEFINAHVPASLQREFLNRLRADLDCAGEMPGLTKRVRNNLTARACLLSVQLGSFRPYRLCLTAKKLVGKIMRFRFRSLALCILQRSFSLLRALKQSGKKVIRNHNSNILQAHPSVNTDHILIDIRCITDDRHYIIVDKDASIACHCIFETGLGEIRFGRRCSVGNGTMIICTQEQGISIGNNSMVSWACTIADNNSHSLDPDLRHNDAWHWKLGIDYGQLGAYKDWNGVKRAPVVIEDDVWIGFESAILAGVTIGRGSVIGARSVVSTSVPPYTVFAGSPARFVRLVPRFCGWTWQELVTALQGAPECTGESSPVQYLTAALRHSREELRIRELPPLHCEETESGFWVRTAFEAGAEHAEWLYEEHPSLVLGASI